MIARWWRQTLLCLILIVCGAVDRAEAYGGATYLDYGYPTLWGYTATWKDFWDPDYGYFEEYDPWCEYWRFYYFGDYVSVVGDLRTPSGWDYFAYRWDISWADLWAWVDNPERDWWYLFGWHYLERDWYVYDDYSGWWYYIGTYYYYLGATAHSAWVPWPEVSFQGVKDIGLGETMTVQVSARNVYPNETVRLLLQGGAIFQGGGTEFVFSGIEETTVQTVEIVGQTASSQEDDVILRAEYPLGDTTAHFTVAAVAELQVTEATSVDSCYVATQGGGDVLITARLQPDVPPENELTELLTWTGGEAGSNRLERRVSRTTAGATTVTASCGTSSQSVNICVVAVTISGPESGDDIASVSWEAAASGGSSLSYEWDFQFPPGSGNNPHVDISPPGQSRVNLTAKWFAYPDSECGAAYESTYTISLFVNFGGEVEIRKEKPLTVMLPWSGPGRTSAKVVGEPAIGFDAQRNLWVVTGIGTLRRIVDKIVDIPPSSQFHNKADIHEEIHVAQFETGLGSDLLRAEDLFNFIKDLTGTTEAELRSKINQAAEQWGAAQRAEWILRLPQAEREAYAVSDQIAPRYVYQNCGRY